MDKSFFNSLFRVSLILLLAGLASCNSHAGKTKQEPVAKSAAQSAVISSPVAHAGPFKADAQLNLKSSYEPGEPIRVGCTCNPVDGVKLTTEWTYSAGLKALDVDDLTKDVWAKKGTHKVSVKLKMLKTHKLTVFVPDPAFPTDLTKAKLQEIEVFDSYQESTLDGEFVQQGEEPTPVVKVAVPNVVGLTYNAAYVALNNAGFDVNLNGPGTGNVVSQVPAAGLLVAHGSTVNVFTEAKPPSPPDPPPSPQTSGPLRVWILEEADDRRDNKYSAQVVAAYSNIDVITYLGSHGQKPGFTIPVAWDDDYAAGQLATAGYTTDVEQSYQAAKVASGANTSSAKEPWLTIQQADSTGKWLTLYSGQITTDNAKDVLPMIKKFGGP